MLPILELTTHQILAGIGIFCINSKDAVPDARLVAKASFELMQSRTKLKSL